MQEIAKFHPHQFLSDFNRPFSLFVELENDSQDTLNYGASPETTVAFPVQGKANKHQVVVYRFLGVDHPSNGVRVIFPIDGQLVHSLKQFSIRYLAASLDKELRIFDVVSGTHIRSIDTQQPFQFLSRVNPRGAHFEYGMVAEACIGYSY